MKFFYVGESRNNWVWDGRDKKFFVKGEPTEIEDPGLVEKLKKNPAYKTAVGRPKMRVASEVGVKE